jgi:hypothetical protein
VNVQVFRMPFVVRRRRSIRGGLRRSFAICFAVLLAGEVAVSAAELGALVPVSGADPLAACPPDPGQQGSFYVGTAVEPYLAVDPTNASRMVGVWQQDRWRNGGARGIVAGVSLDGGGSWQSVVIPGLTSCTGGTFARVTDPWLSFSPSGALFHVALPYSPTDAVYDIAVSRSLDGGLTWGDPTIVYRESSPGAAVDKNSITADPTDARYAYCAWLRYQQLPAPGNQYSGQSMLSRTTDGGESWDAGRIIFDHGRNHASNGHQIVVQPNGNVIDVFDDAKNSDGPHPVPNLALLFSVDKGASWLPRGQPLHGPQLRSIPVTDPNTGKHVRTPADPNPLLDVVVDPRTGALYVVWQDARFSGGHFDSIAFSRSLDGGRSWSVPVKINKTPENIPPADQQAWIPNILVDAGGTLAVTYYDFRFNGTGPGTPTDFWAIRCSPDNDCSDPAGWRDELRLTDASFDLQQAPELTGGLFLGDYMGRAAAGGDFLSLFVLPTAQSQTGAFLRRFQH